MKNLSLCLAALLGLGACAADAATLSATKTVSGTFAPNTTVTYTVVISNTAATAQADNPGNEFVDNVPSFPGLFSVSASATSGTATAAGNNVNWNGAIPAGGSVTITITGTLIPFLDAGTQVSNQGTVSFDADDNGSNESTALTDDPSTAAANDPTVFTVIVHGPGFGAPAARPASTLLLPYFEVGPIPNFPAAASTPGASLNTLVTVNNASFEATLTRVTLWTDYGIPTLSFNLYLTGFDSETLDLGQIFDGVLPRSASAGQDPQDNISHKGPLSQDINFATCAGILPGARPPAADIIGLRNAHTGVASSLLGGQCGSRNHGDGVMRGYLTVDTIRFCDDTLAPNDAGYAAILTAQNNLTASWSIVDAANNSADSGDLVHIQANAAPLPAGTITFYRRFNGDTQRNALGNIWGARYLNGGLFNSGTALRVWREPRATPAPGACGGAAPAFLPGTQAVIVAFDEEENPVQLVPGIDPTVIVDDPLGLVTQQIKVAAPSLGLPFDFGWLYLNLNHDGSTLAQSFVSASHNAAGRFSVGVDSVQLGHPADETNVDISSGGALFFPQAVKLLATKTVAGNFAVGGTVTYTVKLTNQGARTQPNNAGDEFSDSLPGELTLVSASASSGTALADVPNRTVHWNGSIAANATVTITITATIPSTTPPGTVIRNFGLAQFDANLDGTNESQIRTDDPALPGPQDPTPFTVKQFVNIQATKTVAGSFVINGTVTYTVVLTNQGPNAQADTAGGDEFSDTLPGGLTLVSASATNGTALATIATNTVTWNGALAVNGSVTITITATINPNQGGATIRNQGIALADADATPDGVNESQFRTDDPSQPGTNDQTSFAVAPLVQMKATKTVAGTFTPGSTVTYTVTLTNQGPQAQPDNAQDEFIDFLPFGQLTLVSVSASSGTALADVPNNFVTWNGALAANASVTITITATIPNSARVGAVISNQGQARVDANLDGFNENTVQTDDPTQPGTSDPTAFTVR